MNPRVQVGHCVDIIELGICHKGIHFGIASQFVIHNESVTDYLYLILSILTSNMLFLYIFVCLIQNSILQNVEIGLAVAVSSTACWAESNFGL